MQGKKHEVKLKLRDTQVLTPDNIIFEKGEVGLVLELTVKDKAGNVKHHSVRKGESFTRQFAELLFVQMGCLPEVQPLDVRDTSNVVWEIANDYHNFDASALTGDTLYGIQVGTDSTAPTISDYALGTKIDHGTGAGQLQYGNVAFGLPTATAVLSYFTITRDFSNASGGAITVNEIGLVTLMNPIMLLYTSSRPAAVYALVIRDVIAGGVTINNGETLTVNYRQQATA
jgi:hypothetical protein